jgi:ABC-2 type transport system ATP-binding protein
MAELALAGVSKAFGRRPVLVDVDLEVERGEIVGLIGANGAGKTTLMAIVAALLHPDRGRVLVCGIDVAHRPRAAKARLGLAPQDVGVYPAATVRENLRLFAVLNGVRRDLAGAIDEAAEAMGIAGLLDRPAGVLSGGQQRRVHTAVALLHRPRVLLLDEPTVGADVATRSLVLESVRARAAAGAAVLYSTHYLHELDELGASLAVLHHGRVVARGTREELTARVGAPAVRFTFDGPAPAPALAAEPGAAVHGDVLVVRGTDTAAVTARVLPALGSAVARLRSIESVRPTLEDVFAAYTAPDESERLRVA